MGEQRTRRRTVWVGAMGVALVVAACGSSGGSSSVTTTSVKATIPHVTTVSSASTTAAVPGTDPSTTVGGSHAPGCDKGHLSAAVVNAGSTRPTDVQDVRCAAEWATADVIDPVTGSTDAYNLFRYVNGVWVLQGNLQPGCLNQMQAKGVAKAVALQLIGSDLEPTENCG